MDPTHMSLDEIIKKNKSSRPRHSADKGKPAAGRAPVGKGPGRGPAAPKQARVVDARDIICSKTRHKIVDARDKLNVLRRKSDARVRLQKRAQEAARHTGNNGVGGGGGGGGILKRHAPLTANRGPQPGKGAQPMAYRGGRALAHSAYRNIDDGVEHVELTKAERLLIAGKRQPSSLCSNPQSLKRTVHNEVFSLPTSMPPLPRFRSVPSLDDLKMGGICPPSPVDLPWSDPFKLYDMRISRPKLTGPPVSLTGAMPPFEPPGPNARPPRGILRTRSRSPPISLHKLEHLHLSQSMRDRLERAPNPCESMGIFAKLPPNELPYTPQYKPMVAKPMLAKPAPPKVPSSAVTFRCHSPAPPSPPTIGYRIVVSNLHSKVIHEDIQELFEDIGDLIEARLVRPGVAEVIFRTLKDAEKAVDAYHNRQLDGQPMNCLLVHPRASNKPTAPAIKYGR